LVSAFSELEAQAQSGSSSKIAPTTFNAVPIAMIYGTRAREIPSRPAISAHDATPSAQDSALVDAPARYCGGGKLAVGVVEADGTLALAADERGAFVGTTVCACAGADVGAGEAVTGGGEDRS
jgi:hypothetical protein